MKKVNLIIAMIVMSSFFSMSLNAQIFDLTTGTGAIGTNDPIWTLQGPGGGSFNPVRISTGSIQTGGIVYPTAYVQNTCGQWISPWLDAANNVISTPGTAGNFTYRMQFTIDDCTQNPTAQLSLNFMAADNQLTAVTVNGVAQAVPAGITHLASGSMTSFPTVVNGINTIDVTVNNWGAYTALQLCGNIQVFGQTLYPPKNASCCNSKAGDVLSWSPVPGATSYEVSIIYNDPACCRSSDLGYATIAVVTDNVFIFNPATCYSWSVRAVNGPCISKWSEKLCGCFTGKIDDGTSTDNSSLKSMVKSNPIEKQYVDEVMTKVDPNPASNVITVLITNPTETLKASTFELAMVNLSGEQMLRESIQLNVSKQVKVDHLKSGMYICKILADGRVVSAEKVMIK